MEILEKIKKENYGKWKNKPELVDELRDWLDSNTDIDTIELSKAEMVFLIRNGYDKNPVCICGNAIEFKYNKYRKYCSSKCAGNDISTLEKRKATVKEKYGCDNVFQSKTVRRKCEETSIKNWGAKSYMQTDKGKVINKKTMIERYGVENPYQIESVKKSNSDRWKANSDNIIVKITKGRNETYLRKLDELGIKYNFKRLFTVDEYNGCDRKYKYPFICRNCDAKYDHHVDDGTIPICPICNPSLIAKGTSIIEHDLVERLSKLFDISISVNNRTLIPPQEIDIYLQSERLGIELDGIYWHSEISGNKSRKYHLNKTKKCNDGNIRLIHIFEDEWRFKRNIVEGRIKNILNKTKYKLYGRNCTIEEIDSNAKNKFLNKYHIQGEDKSSIRLGAFYRGRLVAVMTFGKRRFDNKDGYELIRYATIGSFSCVGVAGKLLKHFEREYRPKCIISYADLRWSEGNLYKQLGFNHLRNSSPSYFYVKNNQRLNRIGFQKHKLKDKLDIFDPKLSEWENMKANGYDRIWDCGNMVFEKNYK